MHAHRCVLSVSDGRCWCKRACVDDIDCRHGVVRTQAVPILCQTDVSKALLHSEDWSIRSVWLSQVRFIACRNSEQSESFLPVAVHLRKAEYYREQSQLALKRTKGNSSWRVAYILPLEASTQPQHQSGDGHWLILYWTMLTQGRLSFVRHCENSPFSDATVTMRLQRHTCSAAAAASWVDSRWNQLSNANMTSV